MPTITSIVTAWARALDDLLGNDANEAWTEEVLEKIKENGGQLKMVLQACSPTWLPVHSGRLTTI